jgi:(p)ppGpp synthase/HD superfamily hydrolase
MDWLNIAVTHSAKSRIRQWFKKHHRDEHIIQGRQMLEAELGKANFDELLRSDKIKDLGKRLNISEADDILAALGYGDLSLSQVINRIREQDQQQEKAKAKDLPALPSAPPESVKANKGNVSSLGGLMHHLAQCCNPVPGEKIAGVVTRGSGITVHRSNCANLMKVEKDRHMELAWSDAEESNYPAYLVVECNDRVGIARDILQRISDNKINLRDLRVETHPQKTPATAKIHLIVEVKDIDQLNLISEKITSIADVLNVQRQKHAGGKGSTKNHKVTDARTAGSHNVAELNQANSRNRMKAKGE